MRQNYYKQIEYSNCISHAKQTSHFMKLSSEHWNGDRLMKDVGIK